MTSSARPASEIVRDVIERDPVIRNGLARGLINTRALVRHIQIATHEETTFEALVAAIRRYPIKESAAKRQAMGRLIAKLGLKNKVVEVTVRNEPEIPLLLGKFSEGIDYGRGETLSIVSGAKNVRVVIDASNLTKLVGMIPKRNVLAIEHDLAAVIVTYDEAAAKMPGLLAAMTTEIAIEGINIQDFVHSIPDAMYVVREKDALKAYQALERLANEGKTRRLV